LFRLVQRPVWLFGNVADGAGYLCQFLALRRGSQALVQPLLLTGLIFALPVGALLEHHPVTRRDVLGAMVVVLGVGGFVVISRPGAGNPHASLWQWTVLTVLVAAVVGAATLAARDGSQRRRGILLALGAGVLYGYTSAVGEYTARLLDRGVLAVVTSWAPYVLIAAGVIGMLLAQSAFQAGNLRFSLPTLTVAEPLVAIAIGQVLFGEHIASNGLAPALEVLALALMVAGVFLVVRQEETADAR
jgi:drug/metabolite transporter (DMT)-like permease